MVAPLDYRTAAATVALPYWLATISSSSEALDCDLPEGLADQVLFAPDTQGFDRLCCWAPYAQLLTPCSQLRTPHSLVLPTPYSFLPTPKLLIFNGHWPYFLVV